MDIQNLSASDCRQRVATLRVPVESVSHDEVEVPLIPAGPIGGVLVEFTGRRQTGSILDCRLVLAIHAWAPVLRHLGIVRIRHLSGLRPGARVASTGRASGHARGLAFDPRFFEFEDGTVFDVLEDWENRTRGGELCEVKDEGSETAAIRAAVCRGIEAGLFQVVVSPHHNDAHQNHLHLEVVPGASWRWNG